MNGPDYGALTPIEQLRCSVVEVSRAIDRVQPDDSVGLAEIAIALQDMGAFASRLSLKARVGQ